MKINRNTFALLGVVAVTLTASPANLFAATNGFVVPSFRGSANSESGYWEIFTDPYGAPGNLPDQPGATTDAVLTQSNTNAFLTVDISKIEKIQFALFWAGSYFLDDIKAIP